VASRKWNTRPGRSSSQLCRPTTRRRIYARDGHRCQWCGAPAITDTGLVLQLTLDHVIPRSQGGSNRYWNLITACRGCNSRRKDAPAMGYALTFGAAAAKRIAVRIVWAMSAGLPPLPESAP
jgi:hypothetical protein